ncbi:MAG: alkaline phosphatase [Akkermansiaceae bacterium]|nr:alkaline phosphatase [Akkermansiaceae bacterium]
MNPPSSSGTSRRDLLKTIGLGGVAGLVGTRASLADETVSRPAGKVRGIVYMVSDGMSPGVLTLAEKWSQLARGRGTKWWELYNDRSVARGLMDTASANSMVTDSAAASSSWGGGRRVNNGSINIDPQGHDLTPFLKLLREKGGLTGLVTTATVTHATPAGFAANHADRNDEQAIAPQYLGRVDVVLGGGSGYFEAKNRKDGRDLHGEFVKAGYQHVSDRDSLLAAKSAKLLGTFHPGHLPYSIDRDHDAALAAKVPTLAEMATAALSRFLGSDRPFLLQVEGARIDHAAHFNDIGGLLGDQLAFDDALATVLAMTAGRDDILVVATSDHGNSNPGLNGMGSAYTESTRDFETIRRIRCSHERVFQRWLGVKQKNVEAFTALVEETHGFKLKPDEAQVIVDKMAGKKVLEWNHQLNKPEGIIGQIVGNHTGIGWTGTTHTTDPTLVTAVGPQAERFAGIVVNTDVNEHFREVLL